MLAAVGVILAVRGYRVGARYDSETLTVRGRLMSGYVHGQWPHHVWAVEGAHGVGRRLAQRLLARGETVLDVPAKLAARVRVFDTGNARKTDATYAHAVAMVALRTPRLHRLPTELIAGGANKRDLSAPQAAPGDGEAQNPGG